MIEYDVMTSLAVALFLLISIILVFIKVSRRGGGSLTTFMLGATDAFYNRDKKKAADQIVEQKTDKKLTEQESGETKELN